MSQLSARASGCFALALLLTQLGCYPDPEKIRNQRPIAAGNADAATGADAGASPLRDAALEGPVMGPLLPPGATAETCADFGVAWCEKSRQCQRPDFEDLGAGATCAARMKIWCDVHLTTPPDTGWVPAAFKTCITSWTVMSCDEWEDFDSEILKGPSCVVAGRRTEGAGCWSFTQCSTLECAGPATCGKCVPRAPLDGPCTIDAECAPGLVCSLKKCALAGRMGAACSDDRPCRRSLLCRNGVCGPKVAAGQPCGGDHDVCAAGLLCNFKSDACGPALASSSRCSSTEDDGTVLYCGAGGFCDPSNRMCLPPIADGEACYPDKDVADCLWPAICVGNRCLLPRAGTCAAGNEAVPMGPNNAAELTGVSIGDGPLAGADLRKPLKVKVGTPNPRFEIGAAYAIGPGKAVAWAVPVKSLSAELDCGITSNGAVIRDAAGAVVTMTSTGVFKGKVGVTAGGWTDSCLRMGETGYLFGIVTSDTADLFAAADTIELSLTSAGVGTPAPARVLPISYKPGNVGFSVTVRNEGPGPAKLVEDGFSMYLLLDDGGAPLAWGFLDNVSMPGVLAPAATVDLYPSSFFFQGKAARMWVSVEFAAP
jgi:hypothetical protein